MWVSSFLIMIVFWFKVIIFVSSCGSHLSNAAEIVHFSKGNKIKLNFVMTNMGAATFYRIYDHSAAPNNTCLTSEGCNIKVDWKNKCVEQSVSNKNEDKKPERYKQKIITDALTVNLQSWIQNYTLTYDEGTNATIECKTDYQSFYIEWVQKKDTQTIMKAISNENYQSSINMIISRFDDGTTIQCSLYKSIGKSSQISQRSLGSAFAFIKVNYEKSQNFYENTIATSKDTTTYYDSKELLCTGINKRWIKLTKEGLIEKPFTEDANRLDYNNNLKLQLNLNKADNNSLCMCLSLNFSINSETKWQNYKRGIPRLVQLVFDASEKRTGNADFLISKAPVIGGAAGGVIVVVLLVALIFRCARRTEPRSPAPHEVETYACPSTVQYVDLQTIPSSTRRCVTTRDDSPYARIVGFLEPNGRRS
ncbi:hypothetical protein ABMA27_011187 [Loxostege sticticalis]|uniref:Ig-like domain-containing protein n=1 Tax=Loxostege sticticalis TaxID=481309 RepID=A0ABR3H1Y3_LOXSC